MSRSISWCRRHCASTCTVLAQCCILLVAQVAFGAPAVTVSTDGEMFTAVNHETGEIFEDSLAWVTLNHAIRQLSSGVVFVEPGVYPIGKERNLIPDGGWVPDHDAASVTNGVTGHEDNWATEITVHWSPGTEALIAHANFPTVVRRSEIAKLGFWLRPSHTFSDRGRNGNANGGPFQFVLDNDVNCTSPEYAWPIFHPEWVTAEWKWYPITAGPGVGSELPRDPATIRCLGIRWYDNERLDLPTFPYGVKIDDVHGTVDNSWITTKSGVTLRGAGATETQLVAVPGLNHIMVDIRGSRVEFADFELDGNYGAQQAIDYGAGIYNGRGGNDSKIHHNYIHHTKGSGIHIRGSHIEIYENWIEWTENAQINLSFAPSFINVQHNTLRYAFNDGNLWLWKAHDITMECNEMYAVTQEALNMPNAVPGLQVGRWVPFMAKNGSYGWSFRKNRIHDSNTYGMQITQGSHSATIDNNIVSNSRRQGIVLQRSDVTGIEISHNIVEDGANDGIQTSGSDHMIIENWTRNNAFGIDLKGSRLSGSGNYAPEGWKGSSAVGFASSPPVTIDTTFAAGASWSPYEDGEANSVDCP
jgi:parallel beta-helix repeat protein